LAKVAALFAEVNTSVSSDILGKAGYPFSIVRTGQNVVFNALAGVNSACCTHLGLNLTQIVPGSGSQVAGLSAVDPA
jgi:hypothetical protein